MHHVVCVEGRYYYNRRVPNKYRSFDPRNWIKVALGTDSLTEARRLGFFYNEKMEQFWKRLFATGKTSEQCAYEQTVVQAEVFGFEYRPASDIGLAPTGQIIERVVYVEKQKLKDIHVKAVLGGANPPKLNLEEGVVKFFELTTDKLLNKSPNQKRKWKNPRERAMRNFIGVVGNKFIGDLTRDDTLKFKTWWVNRLEEEELVANSANKNFIQLKTIIDTLNENYRLGLDIDHLFKKLLISEDDERKRLSFTTEYLRNTLLNPDNLKGLNPQAKGSLYAFAETGAGLSELVWLNSKTIILNGKIPYIDIRPEKKAHLKTKYRRRKIPLVGYALDVFREFPNGFTQYAGQPDTLSATLSKFLKDNKLLPSDQHSVYSLRHSFQDRLIAAKVLDRAQSDLMGHKFRGQAYGEGSSLEQRLEYLLEIQLKQD